jgi:hypothetical protein
LLTGDFGSAASIWFASDDFSIVKRLLYGSQENRACSIIQIDSHSFLYITDTQIENNAIMLLRLIGDKRTVERLFSTNGPSIYSTSSSKHFMFSTTIEPAGDAGSYITGILSYKKSPTIHEKRAYIYAMDEKLTLDVVFRAEKDYMPYALGQFPTFMFPEGESPPDRFFSYGVSVKKYDNSCLLFKSRPTMLPNILGDKLV